MSQFIVGLTGGIGSGKTLVSDLFAERGIDVIDADIIAREVVEPGEPALQAIIDKFGSGIVDDNQQLNRTALRQKVFSDPALKEWLNQLLHPLIRQRMMQQTRDAQSPYCILAVPLLVENAMTSMVDSVLVVDVEESLQMQRASSRDQQDQEQIRKIMAAQASRSQRLAVADEVIDNNGSVSETTTQVNRLNDFYLETVKRQAKA